MNRSRIRQLLPTVVLLLMEDGTALVFVRDILDSLRITENLADMCCMYGRRTVDETSSEVMMCVTEELNSSLNVYGWSS
jgi:hypothetical protein